MQKIKTIILQAVEVKQKILQDPELLQNIVAVSEKLTQTFRRDGKALFCGNGGSASDAQHLAAELSGRFYLNRAPLFAEALHVNTSFLTAVSNDYGYEAAYARMVHAAGRPGDVLFALSTSGNSPNILRAVAAAREVGMYVVGLTGRTGGAMRDRCDCLLRVPSDDTPRIQEAHILLGHIICELTEEAVFGEEN